MPNLLFFLISLTLTLTLSSPTPSERAHALTNKLSLQEKISLVHGIPGDYVGNTPSITRLSVPALHEQDGPQGVGDEVTQVTCWPSAMTVVASWDRELMRMYGKGMGKEQRGKGSNIMLGPMVWGFF